MSKIFVKDLKPGETIDSYFVVKQRDLRKTQKGDPYLTLKLADKTGDIESRWWDNFAEILPQLKEGVYLRVFAEVGDYQGQKQLTIKKAKVAEIQEIVPSDFLRQTEKNIEELFHNVMGVIETITDPDLKKLLLVFMGDRKFVEKYKQAPAAVGMHSACLGGLLEHVEGMVNLALFAASQYPAINRDLLLAGVILHDIGKTQELEYTHVLKYSDEGLLVGHIVMGVKMLNEKIKTIPDFPEEKRILLEHMLVSHHGQADFGSPKSPMTLEAVALHYIDNLDAKLVGFTEFVQANKLPDSHWTPRSYMFDNRQLYLTPKPPLQP